MLFVALILPLVVLVAVCCLERYEARLCGTAPAPRRRPSGVAREGTRSALDAPTLRLLREPRADPAPAGEAPELRQAS